MQPETAFSGFPVLETERLRLRQVRRSDAADIFRFRGDYQVTRYNFGAPYKTIEQVEQLIDAINQGFTRRSEFRWGITLKAKDDRVIGLAGFNYWNQHDRRASVGYDLTQAYWGRGIIPEALAAIIDFGFNSLNLNRVEADCTVENTASVRVLEKLGFRAEGIQREQYFDEGRFWDLQLFSLLRKEYPHLTETGQRG